MIVQRILNDTEKVIEYTDVSRERRIDYLKMVKINQLKTSSMNYVKKRATVNVACIIIAVIIKFHR
jgi:hypothetical protein